MSHGGLTLGPGMELAVVLSTALPTTRSSGGECAESVAVVATWKRAGPEEVCSAPEEVSELGVVSLSMQLLSSGELNLDKACLSLWDGE